MKKEWVTISIVWAFVLVGFYLVSVASAKSDRDEPVTNSSAQRVYDSHGNHRTFFQVTVTTTPSDPLGSIWDQDTIRKIVLQNDTSNYILIGASRTFNANSAHYKIERGSVNAPIASGLITLHEWTTFNHATFYIMVDPTYGDKSITLQGYVEKD